MKLFATAEVTPTTALARLGFGPQSWVLQMIIGLHALDACRFDAFVSPYNNGLDNECVVVTISTVDTPSSDIVFHDLVTGLEIQNAMNANAWGGYFRSEMLKAIEKANAAIRLLEIELLEARRHEKSLLRCFQTLK